MEPEDSVQKVKSASTLRDAVRTVASICEERVVAEIPHDSV